MQSLEKSCERNNMVWPYRCVYNLLMTKSKEEKERQSMEHSSKKQTLKNKDIVAEIKRILGKE